MNTPAQGNRLINVREAAEMLGVKVSTVRAWLSQRRLPAVHVGRAVRIPLDALEQFIREHTIPARKTRDGR